MSDTLAPPALPTEDALWHVLALVELLGDRVGAAVARRRARDPDPDEEFRGLYVSDEHVDRLLSERRPPVDVPPWEDAVARLELHADHLEQEGVELPLRVLARTTGLDELDVQILVAALAPEIDPRFERLYAYLQDDVTRRRAGPVLALELAGGPEAALTRRWRLGPGGPLVAGGLVELDAADRPFPARSVKVPDRLTAHLLGDAAPDPGVAATLTEVVRVGVDPGHELVRALALCPSLVYVRDPGGGGLAAAASAVELAGRPALVADLARVEPGRNEEGLASALSLETALRGGVLVAGPVDAHPALASALAGARVPVALVGRRAWDTRWSRAVPVVVDAPVTPPEDRAALWASRLGRALPPGLDPAEVTSHFRLTPHQVADAARAAALRAAVAGRDATSEDVLYGARLQSSAALDRLARRVRPRAAWADLVVPDVVAESLRDLAARARHRERVMTEWQMGARTAGGRGIVALFAGPSGTGKTLSAEVLAGELGLDLYIVDLASVVDKYVGETEKNLDRIFDEADRVNGVLLFDEADALFGKRSGVEDAHDRYANIEVAYLLQRMETFDGVAILTSNLRGNLDDAFARRLDAVVELALPDASGRMRLWHANLPPVLPRSDDVDVEFLARFKLSGGNVRNACVAAAYRAAAGSREVRMADLVHGVAREYAKLGHMLTEAEFGEYHRLVSPVPAPAPAL